MQTPMAVSGVAECVGAESQACALGSTSRNVSLSSPAPVRLRCSAVARYCTPTWSVAEGDASATIVDSKCAPDCKGPSQIVGVDCRVFSLFHLHSPFVGPPSFLSLRDLRAWQTSLMDGVMIRKHLSPVPHSFNMAKSSCRVSSDLCTELYTFPQLICIFIYKLITYAPQAAISCAI